MMLQASFSLFHNMLSIIKNKFSVKKIGKNY